MSTTGSSAVQRRSENIQQPTITQENNPESGETSQGTGRGGIALSLWIRLLLVLFALVGFAAPALTAVHKVIENSALILAWTRTHGPVLARVLFLVLAVAHGWAYVLPIVNFVLSHILPQQTCPSSFWSAPGQLHPLIMEWAPQCPAMC